MDQEQRADDPVPKRLLAVRLAELPRLARGAILCGIVLFILALPEVISFTVLYAGHLLLGRPGWSAAFVNAQQIGRLDPVKRVWLTEYRYDPYLLYRYKPNSYIEGWGCTTDSHGFLHNGVSPTFDPGHKPEGTYRIFLLGGSTTASYHAGSNALTIAARLEEKLNGDVALKAKYNVQRFQVVNAAVSGYTSTQEFLRISLELVRYYPDMFILLDGYNEWSMSIFRVWSPHVNHRSQVYEEGFERIMTVEGALAQGFFLFRDTVVSRVQSLYKYTTVLVSETMHKLRRKTGGSQGKYDNAQRTVNQPINHASIEVYRDNLLHVIGLCRVREISCLLLLQPTFGLGEKSLSENEQMILKEYQYALPHKVAYFTALRALFKDLAAREQRNVRVVDLTQTFQDVSDQIYIDFAHYNRLGNERLAESIRAIL